MTISTISLLINQKYFFFLQNCEFFLLEVAEKTLIKKTQIVRVFTIFNPKNEDKDKDKL